MKQVDLWLNEPVNFYGKDNNCYENVIHIETSSEKDKFIEDIAGKILFLEEMDEEMRTNLEKALEKMETERIVKWRAREMFTRKWSYGNLIVGNGMMEMISGNISNHVCPWSLGQYACVKADNADEIYDGDVVQFVNHEGISTICIIEYYYGKIVARDKENGDYYDLLAMVLGNETSIIGNIHDIKSE